LGGGVLAAKAQAPRKLRLCTLTGRFGLWVFRPCAVFMHSLFAEVIDQNLIGLCDITVIALLSGTDIYLLS